ncbi:MAG: GNAT family N-acetyltransferase [Halocynthiibacter sp.]
MSLTLETERLILRKPQAKDADPYLQFYQSARAEYVGGILPADKAWRQFALTVGHWDLLGFGFFAVTRHGDDTCLGMIGNWQPYGWPEPEIAWIIFEAAEGQSIAFEAASRVLDHTRETLRWDTAVSYVAPENTRSAALATRLGATKDPKADTPMGYDIDVYRHPLMKEAT